MSHHSTFNPMNWFANIFKTNHKGAYLALVLSITLTACGGGDDPAQDSSPEPGADGAAPTLTKVVIANGDTSCPSAALGDEVVISITASESIMKPSVSIGGVDAVVTGQHHVWSASAVMTADVADGVLPFDIAFEDNSGEAGVNVTASTVSSNEESEKPDWATVNYCSDGSCIEPCFTRKVLDFEDSTLSYTWRDIGTPDGDITPGTLSSVVDATVDVENRGDTVINHGKVASSSITNTGKAWRGAYLVVKDADGKVAFDLSMAEEDSIISIDVFGVPVDTKMELKLEVADNAGINVSAFTYAQGDGESWETLYFDFSEGQRSGGAINTTVKYGAFFLMYGGSDKGDTEDAAWEWDNITHGNVQSDGPVEAPEAPVDDSAPSEFADFAGMGGGTRVEDTYTWPSGADVWGGFSNDNSDLYPFSFPAGGKITFTGALPAGGVATDIKFKFENDVYPDVDPNFETDVISITSEDETEFSVDIDAQDPNQTYKSFLLYITENDKSVILKDIKVTATDPYADFVGMGGGTVVDGLYTWPSGADVWGGFSNDNADLYPFSFPNGGTITFKGWLPSGGAATDIKFKFENDVYPDVDPNFFTDVVSITSEVETEYSVNFGAQDAAQTFKSFLLYITENDKSVYLKDILVEATP